MKRSLALASLLLFGLAVCILVLLTLFESALVGISPPSERLITLGLLVLPAGIGALLGVLSLARREGQTWLALSGTILNVVFALFHAMILLFAG